MTTDRYDQIVSALKSRSGWETKQLRSYNMRHNGVGRVGLPYQGAPNVHFPLADSIIEKLKAFFVQLLYAQETLASFISKKAGQLQDVTSAVASWLDYHLKQRSNFEREVMIAIDQTQQSGKVVVKTRWDSDCKALAFDAIDPLHVIVPRGTQELKNADWLVHVIHMSEDEYRANPKFNQDDDYIKSIKGKGSNQELSGEHTRNQYKEMREGIGYSDDDNTIVVWEYYRRDRIHNRIEVETISPILGAGEDVEPIRDSFDLPYNRGQFAKGNRLPFMTFRTEIKDKGFYSERGIPEIVFQNEQILNKTWNTELTWMDYFAQPMFRQTQSGVTNPANYKTGPGKCAPYGLDVIQPPNLPTMLGEMKQFVRALAEYRVSMPDLGNAEHLTPYGQREGKKTAREVSAVMDLSGMSNDVRARVFRLDLGELLNLAWSILIQYADTELQYVLQDNVETLDQSAIHDEYEIQPNGSPDSWNKQGQLAKAVNRFQMFSQDPFIDQGELRKSVLELDDPRNVKRLYRDPGIHQADQMEEQAVEIGLFILGFPAPVKPSDDDKIHLTTLGQYVMRKLQTNEPITPEFARLALEHGGAHAQALEQKKDPMRKQIDAQAMPIIQVLQAIAQSDQTNVVQMQAQGAGPSAPSPSHIAGAAPPEPATLSPQPQPQLATP